MDTLVQGFFNMILLIFGLGASWSPIGTNLECRETANKENKSGFFFSYSATTLSLGIHEYHRFKAKKTPLEAHDPGNSFYILENDNYLMFEYIQNTVRERWRLPSGKIQVWTQKMWDDAYKTKYIIRYHSIFSAVYGEALNKKTLEYKRYHYASWPAKKITPTKWVWLKTDNSKKFPLNHEWKKTELPQPTDKEQKQIWPDEWKGQQHYTKIKNITDVNKRWAQTSGYNFKCTRRHHPLQMSAWKHLFD